MFADRPRFANKHEERSLQYVFGVLFARQQTTTSRHNQGGVTLNDRRKRTLVAVFDESLK